MNNLSVDEENYLSQLEESCIPSSTKDQTRRHVAKFQDFLRVFSIVFSLSNKILKHELSVISGHKSILYDLSFTGTLSVCKEI